MLFSDRDPSLPEAVGGFVLPQEDPVLLGAQSTTRLCGALPTSFQVRSQKENIGAS